MAGASAPTDAISTATRLRDETLAAAKALEDEDAYLHSVNTTCSEQLHREAELHTSAAAAQERVRAAADALEQEVAALRDRLRAESHRDDTHDDDDRSVSSDAAAIAHLHTQAAAVQNIKNLVPIVLELQSPLYSKWRGYVLLTLGQFHLTDNVLEDVPPLNDPAWPRMDCVVVSWLFNSISPDVLDIIHEHTGISARMAWLRIEQQFLGNQESQALILDAEFRNLSQGALSIDDYCRTMKNKADALAALGEPVTDRTHVLNVLRGLNERFQFMSQLITRQRPFPSFTDVRSDLHLAELNMAQSTPPPSAFVASPSSKVAATPRPPQGPSFPGGAPPVVAAAVAAGAVAQAAQATKAVLVATTARHGPPSCTRGLGPFTCGLDPPLVPQVDLVRLPLASASHPSSSKPCWLAPPSLG